MDADIWDWRSLTTDVGTYPSQRVRTSAVEPPSEADWYALSMYVVTAESFRLRAFSSRSGAGGLRKRR